MKGRTPTPAVILKARGSRWAKGRGDAALPVERPSCPAWLAKEAKAEWVRMVKLLERMGVLAKCDRGLLTLWCEAWAEFAEALERIGLEGKTAVGSTGNLVVSPWVKIRNGAYERMMACSARFGFSPVDRARLKVAAQESKEADPMQEFLGNGASA